MVATYMKKIMYGMNFAAGVCSREIIYMFLVNHVSGCVNNFKTGIFSDTINVIDFKLCMMVLFI